MVLQKKSFIFCQHVFWISFSLMVLHLEHNTFRNIITFLFCFPLLFFFDTIYETVDLFNNIFLITYLLALFSVCGKVTWKRKTITFKTKIKRMWKMVFMINWLIFFCFFFLLLLLLLARSVTFSLFFCFWSNFFCFANFDFDVEIFCDIPKINMILLKSVCEHFTMIVLFVCLNVMCVCILCVDVICLFNETFCCCFFSEVFLRCEICRWLYGD